VARLLVCLPVCLLLAPAYPDTPLESTQGQPKAVHVSDPTLAARLRQQGFSPRQTRDYLAWGYASTPLLRKEGYAVHGQLRVLGHGELAARDPVAFLEECLRHYDRHVQSYALLMRKRERIGETLHPVEQIQVYFKDKPHSVFFNWLEGARKARRVLYVQGENDNRMLARANLPPLDPIVVRELDSPDAQSSGRYPISDFGLKKAMQRVHRSWKKARDAGQLHVEYLGLHKVAKAGDRLCHKLRRRNDPEPETGGNTVTEVTVYIDAENLLQVGTVLLGTVKGKDGKEKDGQFIAEYFFRDIRLNPKFEPNQFTREAL
jgi:hypothetical protein